MSLLKELGAAIGIGTLTLTLRCNQDLHQGEQARGVATLAGGEVALPVQGLEASLLLLWTVSHHHRDDDDDDESSSRERSRVLLRWPVPFQGTIEPCFFYEAPFALDVPVGVDLAEPGSWHALEVRADLPGAVDVTERCRVSLWPVRPIADTLRAVMSATGWTLAGYSSPGPRDGFIAAVLRPGQAHERWFRGLELRLALSGPAMNVSVTVDARESVWKHLSGHERYDYAFSACDVPTVVSGLRSLLQRHSQG